MTTSKGAFDFGSNWHSFLSTITDERIATAEQHLQIVLQTGGTTVSGPIQRPGNALSNVEGCETDILRRNRRQATH